MIKIDIDEVYENGEQRQAVAAAIIPDPRHGKVTRLIMNVENTETGHRRTAEITADQLTFKVSTPDSHH